MSSRRERHTRDWLLRKFNEAPSISLKLKGYLHINKESNWITFTQVDNDNGERISGHINLPKHKVEKLYPDYSKNNHSPFYLIGKPSFYVSKGTKRGALKIESIELC